MGKIYLITNMINSKKYVGQTTISLKRRFLYHCEDARKTRCENRPLYAAMKKYGVENFAIEELEDIENEKLSEREIYWINELGTFGSNGYNSTKGGDGSLLYDHNEILELYQMGYSVKQVAEKENCNRSTILKVLRAHGIKSRGNSKRINQLDMASNYIQTFDSTRKAFEWLNIHGITKSESAINAINECCKHKRKSASGYKWEYTALTQ